MAHVTDQFKVGTVPFTTVAQAERGALRAILDLDEGTEKRLATLQQLRKNAEVLVEVSEKMAKAGVARITEAGVLQAKAALLEVRIALLREEQKAKPRK
jgi:hypothetical protein